MLGHKQKEQIYRLLMDVQILEGRVTDLEKEVANLRPKRGRPRKAGK